ncbi:metallophosphoesterase [Deinococcus sp. SM5_A1]|uniref:metallophosphoesterase n=1 Tax=Deinococcus sp. SM5_A1 TaxID=3379094 RepID=UPI0038585DAF
MTPVTSPLSRRQLLKRGSAAALVLTAGPVFHLAQAQTPGTPDLVLLNLADLHSAYDRLPQLLSRIREVKARNPGVPHVLLFNGDLFELGNVVAVRSGGAPDWAFMRAIQREMPIIFNIGNHEGDLMDQRDFVRQARALGLTVITNLYDRRTGLPYARTFTTITVGERQIPVLGLGVNALSTYPAAIRNTILPPDPVEFFQSAYTPLTTGSDFNIVLTHAGVVPDKAMLRGLKGVNLMVGGHDHLHLRHDEGKSVYLHNGFKGELLNVVGVQFGAQGATLTSEDLPISEEAGGDRLLTTLIARQRELHLTAEDRAVIGQISQTYTVQEAARWAVEQVRKATGADVVAINHTSFGRGFKKGDVTQVQFAEFLRFDNKLMAAKVDAATLTGLLKLANQDRATRFEDLTGDFIYTNELQPEAGRTYTLVTVDFLTLPQNQERFFGKGGLTFEQVGTLTSKGVLAASLRN